MSEERREEEAEEAETEIIEPEGQALPTSDPVFPTSIPEPLPPAAPVEPDTSATSDAPGAGGGMGSAPAATPAAYGGAGSPASYGGGYPGDVGRPAPRPQRSAAEIRADIEAQRQELGQSVEVLRDKVNELTDWRSQVRKHRREITIGAVAVGFAVGAAMMLGRRRR